MIDIKAFASMRKEMEQFDALREQLIKRSRDVLKASKSAIYSVQRSDYKTAEQQLKAAKVIVGELRKIVAKDVHLAQVGAYGEALEEYVEASCVFSFITRNELPSPKDLGVDADVYLPGLCDVVGELVRKAINASINGDVKTALRIKDFVAEVYQELLLFDFRNIPVRKKFDAIKYGLEKLESLVLDLKLRGKF